MFFVNIKTIIAARSPCRADDTTVLIYLIVLSGVCVCSRVSVFATLLGRIRLFSNSLETKENTKRMFASKTVHVHFALFSILRFSGEIYVSFRKHLLFAF